ncbi:hypothetical protein PFISCL1PPCAC_19148, partial [Pristionchus fissidentatus]
VESAGSKGAIASSPFTICRSSEQDCNRPLSVLVGTRMQHDRGAHKSLTNGERQRDDEGFRLRAVGICLRRGGEGGETLVLLVSAGKNGERWVVPGGGIERGETAEVAAVRELIEEAGVRAEITETMGVFQDDTRKHRTNVFVMRDKEEMEEWEDGKFGRRRCWMNIAEAVSMVKDSHVPILNAVIARYVTPRPAGNTTTR